MLCSARFLAARLSMPVSMLVLLLSLSSHLHAAVSGVWGSDRGDYLVIAEPATAGAPSVVFRIPPDFSAGELFVGSLSGSTLSAATIDQSARINLQFDSASGYQASIERGGSTESFAGTLLLAYQGGSNDAIWQHQGVPMRFFVTLSVAAGQGSIMVLIDALIDSASQQLTLDVASGAATGSGFNGVSLVSGLRVGLQFGGGAPATFSYESTTTGRPSESVESLQANQLFSLAAAGSGGVAGGGSTAPVATPFTLSSTSFSEGAAIPVANVCPDQGGSNLAPQLSWGEPPEGTVAYAIIMDDEVAPCGEGDAACVHWNLFNLPAASRSLNEGEAAPAGAVEGSAYNGMGGYQGPCPPSPHIYRTTIFALGEAIEGVGSASSLSRSLFRSQYGNRILGEATLSGTFGQ